MSPSFEEYAAYARRGRPVGWSHFLYLATICLLIAAVAGTAIFYSLGYQINADARTIEQTGIIQLSTSEPSLEATVSLDGQPVAVRLPYSYSPALPGQYQVTVSKDQYQTWSRLVTVEPNRVVSFRDIVLVRSQPLPRPVGPGDVAALQPAASREGGIEVRQNELWLAGRFVTRFSDDILAAHWYPDGAHVACQLGREIWLLETDGQGSQRLAVLATNQPAAFGFLEKGRILVYQDGPTLKSVGLY